MQILQGQISSYKYEDADFFSQASVIERDFFFESPVNAVTALLQGFHFYWTDSDENMKTIKCELRTVFQPLSSRQAGKIQLIFTFEGYSSEIVITDSLLKAAFSYILIGS